MKKLITIFSMVLLLGYISLAQVPQKISYQAVIRNSSNALVASQAVKMRVTIIKGTPTGTEVYVETHNPTTNANGIVTIEIGGGTVVSGTFAAIDWANGNTYVKTEVDPSGGTSYTLTGTTQLLTVPYAMVANKLSGPVAKMEVKGETTSNDEALFEIKNNTGQTVFAVYNEGVRIYVDNGSKGKGGFSVGGFGTAKSPSQNLLVVSPDSIRAYVDSAPSAKGTKGGFAISSYGGAKGVPQELLTVNPDSIRAYISAPLTSKGKKGGFAISSFDGAKGTSSDYIRITTDSTRLYLPQPTVKGAKGGFAISSFGGAKGSETNYFFLNQDSTRFYVLNDPSGSQSSFNIVGIGSDLMQKPLFTARPDTIQVGGFLNVQNNLTVAGNIGYTGSVTLVAPTVETMSAYSESQDGAFVYWGIQNKGGSKIKASGVVWSTSPNPTVNLATKIVDTVTVINTYNTVLTGLTPGTKYYVRAYATNSDGTGYGTELSFTTMPLQVPVTDADGNVYNTVTIGSQVWFASNLRTTKYNDNTFIPKVWDEMAWTNLSTPGYTWYSNDSLTYANYTGALYNFFAVNTGKLCPTGWHVPTEADWMTLATTLGGATIAGGELKEAGVVHWLSPNTGATNSSGFTALPGGLRVYMGPYSGIGQSANFWSSSRISVDPTSVTLGTGAADMMIQMSFDKMGMSVRCMKDIAK